jgi:type I restriction enzyme, S subunit
VRRSEVPARWRLTTIGEIAREKPNNGIFRKNPEYLTNGSEGLPVVWVEELFRGNSIHTKDSRRVTATKSEIEKYGLKHGDVLFCRSSLKLDGIAFNNVYLEEDDAALFECHLIRVSPNLEDVSPVFLNWLLRSPQVRAVAKSKSKTATMTTIDQQSLVSIPILLPPLAEQRRIAEVLDRAEALRAKRRATLAQLDSLSQSLFLDLFGDPASQTQRFPSQPLETLLNQPLQNGAYYPTESYTDVGGVEMVHMSDAFYEVVPRGNLKRVVCTKSDIEKYALSEHDILIARRSLTLEGAAKPCLIPKSNEPLIFESSFIRVTPHPDKISALYLYHYLGNDRVKQKCVQPYITQSTISGINQSNLRRVPVIVPPMALQQTFARRVSAVEKLKTAQRASLAELDALFATLQHRAFRGEL